MILSGFFGKGYHNMLKGEVYVCVYIDTHVYIYQLICK